MAAAKGNGVLAVERALTILDSFQEGDDPLTLAELARRTGFYKSTLLRLAGSLEAFGYLRRLSDGRFLVGPAVMRLGQIYQGSFRLEAFVRPVLQALVDQTGESASLHVRQNDSRVCLYRVDSRHAIRDHAQEGDHLPLNRGAAGHVLLAFSDTKSGKHETLRSKLVTWSFGERDSETAAVAAPVFTSGQQFVGAISLSGPLFRFDPIKVEEMSRILLASTRDLTTALGGDAVPFEAALTALSA